ncbi:MAG: BamA/TamA family outer membrane protein [Ignavibacterium sp.]|nr:MAG: BamA/TamA family outer membrane protein [Ignavibacterium sp.]
MKHCFAAILYVVIYLLSCNNSFAQQTTLYELSSINFKGNNEFSDSELRKVIQSKESPFWLWKFLDSFTPFGSSPTFFDSTTINVDLVSLKSYYAVNGFFEANFSYSYQLDPSSQNAELNLFITEGYGFPYGNIALYGLEDLTYLHHLITPHANLPSGVRFTQSRLESSMKDILSVLRNHGFMLATFDSTRIIIDTLRNIVDLDIYFTSGDEYRYNEIQIEKNGVGKDLVSNELIRYVTNIEKGQIYDEEEIAKSRLRLARTGLFNTINLKGIADDTARGKATLEITGDIGTLNDLSPEVFIDNEFNTSNIGVGLSYIRKNIFGDARKLTLSTRYKVNDIQNFRFGSDTERDSTFQTQLEIILLLEQPFFLSRNISASLEAYFKTYNISFTDFQNEGGKLRLAFDMLPHTFINLLNPYLTLDILGYDLDFSNRIGVDAIVKPRSTAAIFGTEVGSTTANDIFFPFDGYNLNQVVELALTRTKVTSQGPTNVIDSLGFLTNADEIGMYYKLQTMIAEYLSASRDNNTVVGIKFKIGYMQPFIGGEELIPPNQTFFAGGANSVRGWQARQLVPEVTVEFKGVTRTFEDNIRGGTFIIEGSFEYRRKFAPTWGYTLFLDYGNTWNGYKEVQLDQIAVAIGLGTRYYSPFAPFRIDFGWKLWDPQNQVSLFDRPFWGALEFHFGIGEAF